MEFSVGDVVELKSGGPMMTVVALGQEVEVVWYSEEAGEFRRTTFPAACLERLGFEDEGDEYEEEEDEDEEEEEEDEDEEEEEEKPKRGRKR